MRGAQCRTPTGDDSPQERQRFVASSEVRQHELEAVAAVQGVGVVGPEQVRVRVDLGDDIRVLDARKISDIEKDRTVPEVVILGDVAMYEVVYDDDGNAADTNRFSERELIRETSLGFDTLYEWGEDFCDFFERELVPLGPPQGPGTQTGTPRSC